MLTSCVSSSPCGNQLLTFQKLRGGLQTNLFRLELGVPFVVIGAKRPPSFCLDLRSSVKSRKVNPRKAWFWDRNTFWVCLFVFRIDRNVNVHLVHLMKATFLWVEKNRFLHFLIIYSKNFIILLLDVRLEFLIFFLHLFEVLILHSGLDFYV